MGRKSGGLYINPKKFAAAQKPCMKETLAFLNCLALNQNNDDKCVRQKELLQACMDAQSGKNTKRSWGSINYHLQRLGKLVHKSQQCRPGMAPSGRPFLYRS